MDCGAKSEWRKHKKYWKISYWNTEASELSLKHVKKKEKMAKNALSTRIIFIKLFSLQE